MQRVGCEPYKSSAEYVGYSRGIYDRRAPQGGEQPSVDASWRYESRLPAALDALADASTPLSARVWAQVLVPFVSSLFIRGLDFTNRYASRIPGVTGPAPGYQESPVRNWHDNTIGSGQIEWQRLLAPTMVAQWMVIHGSGQPVLPTNDVARCLTSNPGNPAEPAYAVPLDTSTVLVLKPGKVRRLADWDGREWVANVEHRNTDDEDLAKCGTALKEFALKEVYGPTLESVAFPEPTFEPHANPVGPGFLAQLKSRALIPYLEDYFRLLTVLEVAPNIGDVNIDWSLVKQHWGGDAQLVLNAPAFPGGLASVEQVDGQTGVSLYLDMTRFSLEDVDRALDQGELSLHVSEKMSPALRELLEHDVPTRFSGT